MGHRDLLVTHTLSEAEYHGCRPHPRRSVRRASGFVLTSNPEADPPIAMLATRSASGRSDRSGTINGHRATDPRLTDRGTLADLSGRIRTCGQNKLKRYYRHQLLYRRYSDTTKPLVNC